MESKERKHSIKSMINAVKVAQTITISGKEIVMFPKADYDELTAAMEYLMQELIKPRIETAEPIAAAKRSRPKSDVATNLLDVTLPPPNLNPEALLTPHEVAAEWGIKVKTLEMWRFNGEKLPFVKMGDGRKSIVRYRRKDIAAFVEAHIRNSTSDSGQ